MLEIGSIIDGKYKILNKIGQGGMSIVYLAMNEKANKQWAIKEVRKDGVQDYEVVKQSLIVETDMLKKLKHSGLPSIIDVIEDEERFLIVMDYIEGNSLEKAVEEYGAQPQEKVIEWAKQICDVLGYLHSRIPAIIYRDMKPANIMLKPDGTVILIDFGTAKEFKDKNLADTKCLGTIGYAAPEQFQGKSDARTDIYCLGATLHHLVTGQRPHENEIRPIREINPALSGGLEKIIEKCMKWEPEERYQSAEELMYALEHYNEIDDLYRKNQKKKLAAFLAVVMLAIGSAGISAWGYCSAESKKSENYDEILKTAADYNDYYNAILTYPTRTEAYEQFVRYLLEDFTLTEEEGGQLLKLRAGLDRSDSKGYSGRTDVLAKLKEENPEGYKDICCRIGETFLFYYEGSVERDRYLNAAVWFSEAAAKYPIAGIYCDISECLELINQYNGAKIKQTEKMYEEYGRLWEMIKKLKVKADEFDDTDSKLQVFNEINGMINSKVAQFLEVTSKEELTGLLYEIFEEAGKNTKSVIAEDIEELQASITETMNRVESAKVS
ncbi:MAG: serine/threonine protein kinase [Lachnospiraceae bacterium]|nr:serine/threonine protein kinase [Lachnospiraceae bacterium]